jgi:hypothetical protein
MGAHLHDELEKYGAPEEILDLGARARAYRLDHGAALPNQDAFLGLGLDEKMGAHASLLDLVHFDFDRVRNLVPGESQRLLPDELGEAGLEGKVGDGVLLEVTGPCRQEFRKIVLERLEALGPQRADRMQGVEVAQSGSRLDLRGDASRREPVDLVERDDDRRTGAEDPLGDEAVSRPDPLVGGEHEEESVDVCERAVDRLLHALREGIARPLEPRQVDEHELVTLAVDDGRDPSTRRLRLVRDDRDLPTRERVHERRLADVRPPRYRDEPRPKAQRSRAGARPAGGRAACPRA